MDVAMLEYVSASTAGIVYAELGFIPDFVIHIQDHDNTNPSIHLWANVAKFAGWPTALSLLITGSTGVVTRDTSGITAYAGGDTIDADTGTAGLQDETTNSSPKHVSRTAQFQVGGHITAPGIAIPADHQTNSGRNLIVAFRNDR